MSSPSFASSGMRDVPVSIQPLDFSDIPICAKLSAAAFATDPHTILEENFKRQNFIYVKAVNEQGTVVGYAGWVFSGAGQRRASSRDTGDAKSATGDNQAAEPDSFKGNGGAEEDPIDRLRSLEEADTQYWLRNLVPENMPCMFVVCLAVSPSCQGRGIGSTLLRHGNAVAQERGLSIWVHSSHQAYAAYRKAGFETRRELNIGLDDYAPRPPLEGEPTMAGQHDGRWGEYVIRYMERRPSGN
ncbi:acyl-CoA N-acyltransferase [Nemania diffusa]|nr:acyl-CoA N-acyltransferase [Nemania diffusa]